MGLEVSGVRSDVPGLKFPSAAGRARRPAPWPGDQQNIGFSDFCAVRNPGSFAVFPVGSTTYDEIEDLREINIYTNRINTSSRADRHLRRASRPMLITTGTPEPFRERRIAH